MLLRLCCWYAWYANAHEIWRQLEQVRTAFGSDFDEFASAVNGALLAAKICVILRKRCRARKTSWNRKRGNKRTLTVEKQLTFFENVATRRLEVEPIFKTFFKNNSDCENKDWIKTGSISNLSKPDLIIRLQIIISNQLGVSLFFCLKGFRCKFKMSWIFLNWIHPQLLNPKRLNCNNWIAELW